MLNRSIEKYYPHHFATYPQGMRMADVAAISIVDYAEGVIPDGQYPVEYEPSKIIEVAEIEGKLYLYNKGAGYYRDYLACSIYGVVKAKVHEFPPDTILQENLFNSHGLTLDELMTHDQNVMDQYEAMLMDMRKSPIKPDSFVLQESAINEGPKKIGTSTVELALTTYLQNYETVGASDWPRIPMLTGGTGIAKSSIIGDIISRLPSKWGHRLVTLKVGFIDKSDLLGFVKVNDVKVDHDDGTFDIVRMAQDSPMKELVTATDSFVDACRQLITYADEKGEKLSESDQKAYDIAKEYAKTPVLFWDELNRSSPAIFAQIMVIVNAKRLNNYSFKNAPMLAAINKNTTKDESLDQMYKVTEITDPAMIDRFPELEMDPSSASLIGSFKKTMMKNWGSLLPDLEEIMDRLDKTKRMGRGMLYNDFLWKNSEMTSDPTYELKFPTFRGWDMVFGYISKRRADNLPINLEFVAGLIGKEGAQDLESILTSDRRFKGVYNVQWNPNSNIHGTILEDGFQAGMPVLLTGRFGMAKTAKIGKLIEDKGGIIYNVDLSAADKTLIRGMPDQQSLTGNIFGGAKAEGGLVDKLKEITDKDPLFPKYTTVHTPFDFALTVKKCVDEDRMLCIVFDEVNRCSPVVMSGVFDAISEQRFLGVDLKELYRRNHIRIIAAGNVGDMYDVGAGEKDMDAAVMARFCAARVDALDISDVDGFLDYARKKFKTQDGKASPLVTILDGIPKADLLKILSLEGIDQNDIKAGVTLPSFRTFTSLNAKIATNEGYLFRFEDSAVISPGVSKWYLGNRWKLDLEWDIYDNGKDVMQINDWLDKIAADPTSYPDQVKINVLRELDDMLYNAYWKDVIYEKNLLGEGADLYRQLIRQIEIAMYAKYNVFYVTPESLALHIVKAYSKDVQTLTAPVLIRIIHEQFDMRMKTDLMEGIEPLKSSGLKELLKGAVESAQGSVPILPSEAEMDLVIGKYLKDHTEIEDDGDLNVKMGAEINIEAYYENVTEDFATTIMAQFAPIYELDYANTPHGAIDPADPMMLSSFAVVGMFDRYGSKATIEPAIIKANSEGNVGSLYVIISGGSLQVIHLVYLGMNNTSYRRLRLIDGLSFSSMNLNFSNTAGSVNNKNVLEALVGGPMALATFEGVANNTQLTMNAYALPFNMNSSKATILLDRLQSGAVITKGSVSGNPMDALNAIEAELTSTDTPFLDATTLGQSPVQFTLQKWSGALQSAFLIIKSSFKKV